MLNKLLFLILALAIVNVVGKLDRLKKLNFDVPSQIYTGRISGQTITFNYSRYASPKASEVQFVLFIIVGDDQSGKQMGWIKTQNSKDFHYSAVWGNHQTTYFSWYSDTFTLKTTPDQTATLSVSTKFGGLNNGFNLYVSGYWELFQSDEGISNDELKQQKQTVIV